MATKTLMPQKSGEPDEEIDLGIESEEDLSGITKSTLRHAVVFSTDWTTEVLINQLSKGNIDLDPAFQRRDAWNVKRKSLFIESLIAGIPIPQIVLAEKGNSKGSFLVIDGKQRLLSIQRFTKVVDEQEPFALEGLRLRSDLNGYTYKDLKGLKADLNAFENQTIRTVVIRNWKKEDLLYLIFHRLNSETLPLSPQELRQALHPGPFLTYCDKHSQSSNALKKILNLKKPDFRMRDIELLVRYFAFRNFAPSYRGNLKKFLDNACEHLNRRWKVSQGRIQTQAEDFEDAVKLAYEIFDGSPFRKWEDGQYEPRFNRAIFDVVVYFFADRKIRNAASSQQAAVLSAFKRLCTRDSSFIRAVESTTKSKSATITRFNHWAQALTRAIGIKVAPPKIHE
jgi:hypothetical protein